jgi:hypothetical protein
VKVGDSVPLEGRDGAKAVRVAGTVKEYTVGGMALCMDYGPARRAARLAVIDALRWE